MDPSDHQENMTVEEGKNLVAKAIRAGIFNDLGSGGNVDVCVITKDGGNVLRNWQKADDGQTKEVGTALFSKQ